MSLLVAYICDLCCSFFCFRFSNYSYIY